jgi:hypothetical protein|tara:strand:- start:212 stop:640 length:429 start_codon:yes stop_codon:yes gene_type:complete
MQNKNLPHDNLDLIAYAAGLFDGEGNINYAQYKCKKPNGKIYLKWNVGMEIAMTDLNCIKNFYDIVKVGSIHFKGIGKGSLNKKEQWRWRCSHQKALKLAKLFLPYSVSKRNKLLSIINHYEFKKPIDALGKKFPFIKTKKS